MESSWVAAYSTVPGARAEFTKRLVLTGDRSRSQSRTTSGLSRSPSHDNLFVDLTAEPRTPSSEMFLDSLISHEMQRPLETIDEAVGFAKSWIGHGSLCSCVFTLVASAMGAGCLSLPHMFRQCGLGSGILLLACGALLAHISLVVIMACARYTGCKSFAELVSRSDGSSSRQRECTGGRNVVVDMVIAFYGVAAVLIYMMLIGDFLGGIAESPLFGSCELSRTRLILGSLLVVFPLSVSHGVSALRYISILSTSSICFMAIVVLCKAPGLYAEQKSNEGDVVWFTGTWKDTLQSFSIGLFAFNAHTNAVPVATALAQPRAVRIWQVSLYSVVIEFVVYALIATGGYLSFRASTQQDFIRNYPVDDQMMLLVRCIYSVPVVLGVPINLSPAAASLQALARRALSRSPDFVSERFRGTRVGNSGISPSNINEKTMHVVIVATVLLLCATLAVFCEAIADVIGLLGGFFGTLIVLVWPQKIYRSVLYNLHPRCLALPLRIGLIVATGLGVLAFCAQVLDTF